MPARNEPCPCASRRKYKRCCLERLDAVAGELRDRDALLAQLAGWAKDEHASTFMEANDSVFLIRVLRGVAGRLGSLIWVLNDFVPADGGPPLIHRFAERSELDPGARRIVAGLAAARLDVHRVIACRSDRWIVIEPLRGGGPIDVMSDAGLAGLRAGDLLVARIVHATSVATPWGAVFRFPAETERRWRACLDALPEDSAAAALEILGFEPEDAAEPLPDRVDLLTRAWPIEDDDAVLEALEEDPLVDSLGGTPGGWAFARLDDADSGHPDLGGASDDDIIEVARIVVSERELRLVAGAHETLSTVITDLESGLGDLMLAPYEQRAA
jgi:hypothetical protein